MGIRSYMPELGAFASEDPVIAALGNGATASRYSYAFGNPRSYLDLTGEFAAISGGGFSGGGAPGAGGAFAPGQHGQVSDRGVFLGGLSGSGGGV